MATTELLSPQTSYQATQRLLGDVIWPAGGGDNGFLSWTDRRGDQADRVSYARVT